MGFQDISEVLTFFENLRDKTIFELFGADGSSSIKLVTPLKKFLQNSGNIADDL